MYKTFCIWIAGAAGLTAIAQTQIDLRTQAKRVDFTAAGYTKPVRLGSTLPGTCTTGELFFLNPTSDGSSLYACTASNTWSAVGSQSCRFDTISSTLQCRDASGNMMRLAATSVGALADPGANGIPYRSGNGTSQPANASQMTGPVVCQDGGTVNAYACSLTPPITTYTPGATYRFQAGSSNTGAATANLNGLGAKNILKQYNQPLSAGDIRAGQWVIITYDGMSFQMQSQTGNGDVVSFKGRSGAVTPAAGDYTTDQVTEGGNQYFTNSRAQGAFAFPGVVQFLGGTVDCPTCITTATTADTDLSGYFPHLSVAKLQGRKLSPTAPSDLQYLGWNSASGQWEPKSLPTTEVSAVFGRSGAVTAQSGDYSFSQISGTLSAGQLPAVALRSDAGNTISGGTQDFSAAAHTLPMKSGPLAGRPASCTPGETYFATDASQGTNLYGCSSLNTWSLEGATTSLQVESNGTLVGSRGTANLLTGPGLMSIISDDGTAIDILSALDTAVVQTQPGEQSGAALWCQSSTRSVSAYQCSLNPTATAYTPGMVLHWVPDVNGAGGTTTLNVDSLGAALVKLADGSSNPGTSDIVAGRMYTIWYDGASFRLPSAGSTTAGLSDPGANGLVYRNAANVTAPATADNVSALSSCQDAGTANAYACGLAPAITSYKAGTTYWFRAANANTGPSTIALNSLPPQPIKKYGGLDLSAGDIKAGQWLMVTYDGSNMQMQSQTGNAPAAGVASIFGRTGSVMAQAGDYTAAQVTNAVDQTARYSDPSWISGLSWSKLIGAPGTFTPSAHAASHQNGGSDEIATATPGASAIPKADATGKLAVGWIPTLNQSTTGNAATATALQNLPTQCTAGNYPLGIDVQGNAQNCTPAAGSPVIAFSSGIGYFSPYELGGNAALTSPQTGAVLGWEFTAPYSFQFDRLAVGNGGSSSNHWSVAVMDSSGTVLVSSPASTFSGGSVTVLNVTATTLTGGKTYYILFSSDTAASTDKYWAWNWGGGWALNHNIAGGKRAWAAASGTVTWASGTPTWPTTIPAANRNTTGASDPVQLYFMYQ